MKLTLTDGSDEAGFVILMVWKETALTVIWRRCETSGKTSLGNSLKIPGPVQVFLSKFVISSYDSVSVRLSVRAFERERERERCSAREASVIMNESVKVS